MDENQESLLLLQEIAGGSLQSFDRFYEKHIGFVFNIAYQIVKNQAEAEDICHDVFIEVYQKISQYHAERGSVKAWLAVKTRSRALDRLRKKKPYLVHKMEKPIENEDIATDILFIKRLEHDLVLDALDQIPSEQREAIYRAYFQEETHKEIAETMKKPLGSVKSLIRYGLNNLRKQKSIWNWAKYSGGGNHND